MKGVEGAPTVSVNKKHINTLQHGKSTNAVERQEIEKHAIELTKCR